MKNTIIASIGSILILASCGKKQDYEVEFSSKVTSHEAKNTIIEASISSSSDLNNRGLLYSADSNNVTINGYSSIYFNQYISWGKILDETNSIDKTYRLVNLKPGATYYYRLFSVFNGLIKYGEQKSFQIDCDGLGCGPAGGQIIFLDNNGHGIEVAANYVTPNRSWGCSNIMVGGLLIPLEKVKQIQL